MTPGKQYKKFNFIFINTIISPPPPKKKIYLIEHIPKQHISKFYSLLVTQELNFKFDKALIIPIFKNILNIQNRKKKIEIFDSNCV